MPLKKISALHRQDRPSMQVGDLVEFLDGFGWLKEIEGKIGIVVAIRPSARSRWYQWDCLINGVLQESFYVRLDDPGYLKCYGVEILNETV